MFVKGKNRLTSAHFNYAICIDDPDHGNGKSRANNLELPELVVDLYNGAPTTDYTAGILIPLSLPIVATNFYSDTGTRYVCKNVLTTKSL